MTDGPEALFPPETLAAPGIAITQEGHMREQTQAASGTTSGRRGDRLSQGLGGTL